MSASLADRNSRQSYLQSLTATVNQKFWPKLRLAKPPVDQGYPDIEYQLSASSLWRPPTLIERNIISAVD